MKTRVESPRGWTAALVCLALGGAGGCGDSEESGQADAGTRLPGDPDAGPSTSPDGETQEGAIDAGAREVEVLAPPELGPRDFAVHGDSLFVVGAAGTTTLYRCPSTGCSATPEAIVEYERDADVRQIEAVGDTLVWVSPDFVEVADLDGTNRQDVGPVGGTLGASLAVSGNRVYFGSVAPGIDESRVHYVDITDRSTGTLPAAEGGVSTGHVLAAAGDFVAYWRGSQPVEPQPVHVLELGTGTPLPSGDMAKLDTTFGEGLVLAQGWAFFAGEAELDSDPALHGCEVGGDCGVSAPLAEVSTNAIDTDGDEIFVAGFDEASAVVSYEVSALQSGVVEPTYHGMEDDFFGLNARHVAVDDERIYALYQYGGDFAVGAVPR